MSILYADQISEEIRRTLNLIDEYSMDEFIQNIINADRIYCAGAGRSGNIARSFANRLMQMGLNVYVVGESTVPSFREKDLLIVCSGSGETKSVLGYAQKAIALNGTVALITINDQSSIARLADTVVVIDAVSPKSLKQGDMPTIQPLGNLFEQTESIFLDIVGMVLMERLGISEKQMYSRHANLE